MKKVKILIISDTYEPHVDGVARYISEIEKHYNFTVYTSYPRAKIRKKSVYTKSYFSVKIHGLEFSLPSFSTIRHLIGKCDVVFINSFGPSGIIGLLYAKIMNKPIIGFLHCYDPHLVVTALNLPKFFEKILKIPAKRLYYACDSLLIENLLVVSYVKSHPKIVTTVFGVDKSRFMPANITKKLLLRKRFNLPLNKILVLYSGRISHQKRIKAFCKIVDLVDKNLVEFFVVGDGPQRKILEDICKRHSNVHYYGSFMKRIELAYQSCDIMISLITDYSVNQTFMEGCACGLPVVTFKAKVNVPFLFNRLNTIISDGTPESYAKSIEELAKNENLRSKISYNAEKISYLRSWEKNAEIVVKLAKELIVEKLKSSIKVN